ncbi:DUF2076 domain-containing protein [Azohydromonas caseinilytica]|uniref:DUF2076 domain-containing protein n=1 Tax=Azohydromonas caseinilytica TaxID=2728836 RepID=A0A848FD14_9BURK|nr:DUF2076 family protein [Azohydromonas caseinilytica]NML16876.1 DUF2076 domain-containing protein [Azohydromonas caseinilytica]
MNAEEKLRVARLVTRLARAPEMPQDEDAALELAALMKVRPDAPYLLMQRALGLELALEQAQAELEQLRRGQGQPAAQQGYAPAPSGPVGRVLSRLSGGMQRGVPAAANPGYPPGYGPAPGYGPGAMAGQAPAAGGGFLRNAAAVGAGVLGGSLLFHGLDALFHDHDHPNAGGQGLLSGDMQAPLDALSGNEFVDPANDPLAGGGDPFSGDMLGDGGEFDDNGDDWA